MKHRALALTAFVSLTALASVGLGIAVRPHRGALHAGPSYPTGAPCNGSGSPDPNPVAEAARDPGLVAEGERETLFGARAGTPIWPIVAFFRLPAKAWGRPDLVPGSSGFRRQVFRRYGLHYDAADNDGLPVGLLRTEHLIDGQDGFTVTCQYCHSASLFGRVVVGQPNPWADMERLWVDLAAVTGASATDPLYSRSPLGNSVVNGVDHMGLLGLLLRHEDGTPDYPLVARWKLDLTEPEKRHFDELAYIKTLPWYTFAARQAGAAGLYWDGGQPKSGNFAAHAYLSTIVTDTDAGDLAKALTAWKRSGPAYLARVAPPPYPFAVDGKRAARGRRIYDNTCANCHGSYAPAEPRPDTLSYPGRVIPVESVGTDPRRAHMPEFFVERTRIVLKERYAITHGYVPPPLTAIWARAPYLHNGSVPTLAELLDPPSRRAGYVLSADPDRAEDYDQKRVGWRVDPLPARVEPGSPLHVFDPARVPGLGNQGHPFGAHLPASDKTDLVEFLKTL